MNVRRQDQRAGILAMVLVVGLLAVAAPASAGPLPPVLGWTRPSQPSSAATTSPAINPPSGGTVIPGESLAGATSISSSDAHGGAYGSLVRASAPVSMAPGTYRLTAAVKAPTAARADLLLNDLMAGSYGVGTSWRTITGMVTISSTGMTVGVGSWIRSGTPTSLHVDWLHLAATGPAMTVRGSGIAWENGNPYRPRGFNRGDYQDSAKLSDGRLKAPRNEAVEMFAWGPTMVRIGLNQEFWLANCAVRAGTATSTYRAAVRSEIDDLTARGVFVMISLVSTERGANTGCEVTEGVLREMADQRSLTFWGDMATLYKANGRVVFDLFNEPHSISDAVWRNGGTVSYGANKSFQAVGMQQLYNKVRSTGATNLVFVSGNRWASDPRVHLTHPLDGYGVVAGAHSYCRECSSNDPQLPANLEVLNSAELRLRMPLTITETGWQLSNDSRFNRAMIDWAEASSVGWLVYSWLAARANGTPDAYSIVGSPTPDLDVGGVMTRTPARSGAPVWNTLAPWRTARGFAELPQPE